MGFIKKYWEIILATLLIVIYFFSRLFNILTLPIFTDEAIYVRWSQIAAHDPAWRFISLTDGKQPMFVWIAMILMKFISNPLLAGRIVSVIAGFISMVGIYFLGSEIFKNKKIGIIASLIYVLYPFSLVYDRMALYDSLVAMFIIWSLYFEVLLARYMRLDLSLILGMIIGGGMLTKTNADFALILLPFSLLLFNLKEKNRLKLFIKWLAFAVTTVVIANLMYTILRLSPFYHIIADKNLVFIYSPKEWIKNPLAYFLGNFRGLFGWLVTYTGIPFIILIISSFFVGRRFLKEKLLLLIWFVIPFLALAFFGKVIYPRFILFMTMPLLVLAAYTLYKFLSIAKKTWLKTVILLVFLLMFAINDFFIITDFKKATIPDSDRSQFITSWPSGVGVKETISFLKKQSTNQKIYVGTEGTFGLMPYALDINFYNDPNIKIVGYWPIDNTPPKDLLLAAKKMPTFIYFYQPCSNCSFAGLAPLTWPVTPVITIYDLENKNSVHATLYKVNP